MSVPPHWLLGAEALAACSAHPQQHARVLASMLSSAEVGSAAPEKNGTGWVPRVRLQPAPTHASMRAKGSALCSRERREKNVQAQLITTARASRAAVQTLIEEAHEIERQIEEGVLLPDGTPALVKRKRPTTSIGRAIAAEEKEQKIAKLVEMGVEPGTYKKKSPGAGGSGSGDGVEDKEAAKQAKRDAKAAAKAEKEAAKEAEKAAKAAAKKAKKSGVPLSPFEAGAVVEVSLRLGEAFANWYEAQLVEIGKANKWKLQLVRHTEDDDGEYETLHLQGRPEFESAPVAQLRPIPPEESEWFPVVGENCELFFEDGWWKVRVLESAGNGEWTVLYQPAQATHIVPRKRLRPTFTYDGEAHKFAPIKISGRR